MPQVGDGQKRFRSGEPLLPRLQSSTLNAWQDAAADLLRRRAGGASDPTAVGTPEGLIWVKNTSDTDRARFEVLGVDDILFTRDDNQGEFENRPSLKCSTPDKTKHAGKFVILYEPIKSGGTGRAYVLGYCVVQANVVATTDTTADVTDGDATQLTSGDGGAFQILAPKLTTTGKQWVFGRFQGAGGATSTGQYQYMVYMMTSQNQAGWGYVAAAPM